MNRSHKLYATLGRRRQGPEETRGQRKNLQQQRYQQLFVEHIRGKIDAICTGMSPGLLCKGRAEESLLHAT